jgi:hypothetical protein
VAGRGHAGGGGYAAIRYEAVYILSEGTAGVVSAMEFIITQEELKQQIEFL